MDGPSASGDGGLSPAVVAAAHAKARLALALAATALAGCFTGTWLVYDWLQNNHPRDGLLKGIGVVAAGLAIFALDRAQAASRAVKTGDPYPADESQALVQRRAKAATVMAVLVLMSPIVFGGGLVLLVLLAGNVAR